MKTTLFCILVCLLVVVGSGGALARNIPVAIDDDISIRANPPKPNLPTSWYDPNVTLSAGISTLSGPVWYDAPASQYKQLSQTDLIDDDPTFKIQKQKTERSTRDFSLWMSTQRSW